MILESLEPLEPLVRHVLFPKGCVSLTLIQEFYANVDEKVRNPRTIQYKVFIKNKIVDISTTSLNDVLPIADNGHLHIDIDKFNPTIEELLKELPESTNVGINLEGYLPLKHVWLEIMRMRMKLIPYIIRFCCMVD